MTESELRNRLRATPIDSHPDAEARAWEAVRSAYRPAAISHRRHRWRLTVPVLACALAAAAIVVATASAPREALARWFRQAIGLSAQPHPRPKLTGLPSPGQLLIDSPDGPWIVESDGSRRYLGPYTAAAWSPHSLYVVAWRGSELAALDLRGRLQWKLTGPGRVTVARWSPDGYRIAYRAGGSLRVVAGDGSGDHPLAAMITSVAPAWQPHEGPAHRIVFLDRRGDIELRDADTAGRLWRVRPPAPPHQLLWSPDGTRLLAVAAHQLSVYSARGRLLATSVVPSAETIGPATFAAGGRVALIVTRSELAAASVLLLDAGRHGFRRPPETLFTAPETLTGIDWSPNARWLVTSSPSADQWIFIRVIAPTRFTAVSGIAQQFRAGHRRASGSPLLAGWQP